MYERCAPNVPILRDVFQAREQHTSCASSYGDAGVWDEDTQATDHAQIFGSVQKASHIGETAVYEERGIDTDMRKWVTVQGGNVCPDCQSREGQVEPYEFWEAIGLPGSGWSVCKQHCQCRLPAVAINAPDKVILESA